MGKKVELRSSLREYSPVINKIAVGTHLADADVHARNNAEGLIKTVIHAESESVHTLSELQNAGTRVRSNHPIS